MHSFSSCGETIRVVCSKGSICSLIIENGAKEIIFITFVSKYYNLLNFGIRFQKQKEPHMILFPNNYLSKLKRLVDLILLIIKE